MAYKFSLTDVVTVSRLIGGTLDRIQHAPEQFRVFAADLQRAQTMLSGVRNDWSVFENEGPLRENETLHNILTGIKEELEELLAAMKRNPAKEGFKSIVANWKFGSKLEDLRERLQFHFGSLALLFQVVVFEQFRRRLSGASGHSRSTSGTGSSSLEPQWGGT